MHAREPGHHFGMRACLGRALVSVEGLPAAGVDPTSGLPAPGPGQTIGMAPGLPQAPPEHSRAPHCRGCSDVPDTALRPHSAAQRGRGLAAPPSHAPHGGCRALPQPDAPPSAHAPTDRGEKTGLRKPIGFRGQDEWSHRKPPLPGAARPTEPLPPIVGP